MWWIVAQSTKPKRSPAEGELPFEYDWERVQEVLTAYAGIPLFVRIRFLGRTGQCQAQPVAASAKPPTGKASRC